MRRTLTVLATLTLAAGLAAPAQATVFPDVDPGSVFASDIDWLASEGITTGAPCDAGTCFYPVDSLTREAAATWVARFLGHEMTVQDAPAWAVEAGISGIPAGDPSWQDPITREAMAAFLYRAADSPAFRPPFWSPFEDVRRGAAFYREIMWLKAVGITAGVDMDGDGRPEFCPTDPLTREAGAAWLHRLDGALRG